MPVGTADEQGSQRQSRNFYGCRIEPRPQPASKRKQLPISRSSKGQARQDPVLTELRHGLAQLGVTNLTDKDIRQALTHACRDGHQGVESAELLRAVFGELQRRNTADNLSGEEPLYAQSEGDCVYFLSDFCP